MKRIGRLYERVISPENLRLADEHARKGKQNSYGVRVFDRDREGNLQRLHRQLAEKTFHTSAYSVFKIYEPKERLIYRLPYYPDRIVHHAIMNVLEPIWVRTLTHNTYACIKGRGVDACVDYVGRLIAKYDSRPLYCLKLDIRKFYPSVRHEVIKRIVRKKIKDKDLLWLLDEIIDSADGLPIGNYLSQYLANLVLCHLMHHLNEVVKIDCAEYADDIICLADSKERLRNVFTSVLKPCIEEDLQLRVKDNWQIFPIAENRQDKHGRGLDYIGVVFYRKQRLMRKRIKQNFARKVKKVRSEDAETFKKAVSPWLGWAKKTNSKHLLVTIIPKSYESIL